MSSWLDIWFIRLKLRDDITFVDPLNTFIGIENYKLIFWALTFDGKILFRDISLDVLRIWQPSENMILIRWNLRGVPRVPWDSQPENVEPARHFQAGYLPNFQWPENDKQ
ncbi:Uncharacterized protein Adt_13951 [Abeliophyllum distichum]|uniref:Uncharacterized protein n=1 Tax=Abeliophyllum distichum TaxID=126358 RepID=A0ABD1TY98_9LAMI